jgi:HD-GYP domain-containing protein (c-di-GMP phosphodiesterase class II)
MTKASAQENFFDEKILQLASAIDEFEGYQNPHGSRIADLTEALAKKFEFSSYDILTLRQAALIHDIGEFVMNREYIKVSRNLSQDERIDMHRHPVIGEQESAKRGFSRGVQLLVRWHHEWWNGGGYPDALRRENIPLAARILRVADSYCAITDARSFRTALPADEARRHLAEWAGIEFDPQIVKYFFDLNDAGEGNPF